MKVNFTKVEQFMSEFFIMYTYYRKHENGLLRFIEQYDQIHLNCDSTLFFEEISTSKISKDCFAEESYYGLIQFIKHFCVHIIPLETFVDSPANTSPV